VDVWTVECTITIDADYPSTLSKPTLTSLIALSDSPAEYPRLNLVTPPIFMSQVNKRVWLGCTISELLSVISQELSQEKDKIQS